MRRSVRFWCAAALTLVALASAAQEYPARPARIVVPYAAGGTSDLVARLIAQKLSERMQGSFIVDNKPGAGGRIGFDSVAKAAPDGYTLVSTDSSFAMLPALYAAMPYQNSDLQPVSLLTEVPLVLVAAEKTGLKSLQEVLAYARANPGKLNFGSGGIGSATHLAGELLRHAGKVNLTHIPYKGAGEAMKAVLAGEVDLLVTAAPTATPHIKAARVQGIAVTTTRRAPALPDVPTSAEAGLPAFSIAGWVGLAVPRGTPAPIVTRLQREAAAALAQPEVRQKLAELGSETVGSSPEEFQRVINAETERWKEIVKAANVRLD